MCSRLPDACLVPMVRSPTFASRLPRIANIDVDIKLANLNKEAKSVRSLNLHEVVPPFCELPRLLHEPSLRSSLRDGLELELVDRLGLLPLLVPDQDVLLDKAQV